MNCENCIHKNVCEIKKEYVDLNEVIKDIGVSSFYLKIKVECTQYRQDQNLRGVLQSGINIDQLKKNYT